MQLLTSCLSQYKKRQLSFPMAHSQVPALQAEAVTVALDYWCLVLACAGTSSVHPGMVLQGLQLCSAFFLCWVMFSEACGNVGNRSYTQIAVPLWILAGRSLDHRLHAGASSHLAFRKAVNTRAQNQLVSMIPCWNYLKIEIR